MECVPVSKGFEARVKRVKTVLQAQSLEELAERMMGVRRPTGRNACNSELWSKLSVCQCCRL